MGILKLLKKGVKTKLTDTIFFKNVLLHAPEYSVKDKTMQNLFDAHYSERFILVESVAWTYSITEIIKTMIYRGIMD